MYGKCNNFSKTVKFSDLNQIKKIEKNCGFESIDKVMNLEITLHKHSL